MIRFVRNNWFRALLLGLALVGTLALSTCGGKESSISGSKKGRRVLYWRSSMDPSFVSQRPGKDAMGMDLLPVYEGDPSADLTTINVAGATLQRMGLRTQRLTRKRLGRIIRSVATIVYDERTLSDVNMKFDGWIEKLYVNETGQLVKKGQPLFDIYSPELVASAEEYLQAAQGASDVPHMRHLLRSARERLELFDLPKKEIDRILKTGDVPRDLRITAPADGYVIEKNAFEGTFVKTGSRLFRIAQLDTIWVYMDIYEYELPWMKNVVGAEMELTYVPGREFLGKIDYVYPFLDEMSRTIKVRLVFPNPDLVLKPGMFATVRLHSVVPESVLVVPSEAVIHSGKRNIAFVYKGEGRFDPREVRLGRQGENGDYEVLDGLKEGEDIVTSGEFLLDSESRLKEAIAKMLGSNLPQKNGNKPSRKSGTTADSTASGGLPDSNQRESGQ